MFPYIKKIKEQHIVGLFLVVIAFFTYRGVFSTFFQQDEWATLGYIKTGGWGAVINNLSILQLLFAEGRILGRIFYLLFLGVFQFNLTPIFFFAISCHAVNAWLVYHLAKRLKGTKTACVAAAVFFAVNSLGNEAVTWAAAVFTVPATTLLLISLIWYIDFLETKDIRKRNYSFAAGILSLFIKETGLFLFIFYPLLYFLWGKSRKMNDVVRANAPLLLYGTGLIIFRITELFFVRVASAGFVDNQKGGFIFPIIYHCIMYPLTSLSQLFVPAADLYAFVPRIVRSEYIHFVGTGLFDLVGQSIVADLISLLGTILLLVFLACMLLKEKRNMRTAGRTVIVGILLVMLSFLPYAVLHRFFSYMSYRYYYVGVAGAALLFGYIVTWFYKRIPKVMRIVFFIIVCLYLLHHVQAIQKDLDLQIQYAGERKTFLQEIKRVHPTLQEKSIFYITSDKKYLGEITYPFQSGLGYILEVWYYDSGKVPKMFIQDNFLWDLGEEGYRSMGKSGFGYFEHLDKLGELVKEGKITPEIVYGYIYNSKTRKFSDVTGSVREQLATFSGTLK